MTAGRGPEADVVLLDETVSKLHAELSWDAERGRCFVCDSSSRNGSYVDDVQLTGGRPHELIPGAVVRFGSLATRFYSPRPFLGWLSSGASKAGGAPTA